MRFSFLYMVSRCSKLDTNMYTHMRTCVRTHTHWYINGNTYIKHFPEKMHGYTLNIYEGLRQLAIKHHVSSGRGWLADGLVGWLLGWLVAWVVIFFTRKTWQETRNSTLGVGLAASELRLSSWKLILPMTVPINKLFLGRRRGTLERRVYFFRPPAVYKRAQFFSADHGHATLAKQVT